eukprot:TRINITY_DN83664_c1_g1_i1.p1 TRINITY_DN83664_c1_g1~~TRINITY_DN83664_c1_g1_i1.p1  ORF type:complete len:241 (+),score=13.07 TRINITY_DN83664_c1_g1_i1:69-725(+)
MQVASIVLCLVFGVSASSWQKPWFCHSLDCPQFTLIGHTRDYEIRKYSAATWVSTHIEGMSYDAAEESGFARLFNYISGANEAKKNIPMTSPVRFQLQHGAGPFCKDNFTTSFFVPYDLQGKAPAPTESDIYIEQDEEYEVYVQSFPGYADEKKVIEHIKALTYALTSANITDFDSTFFYMAGYDSPFRFIDRHNEVWLKKITPPPAQIQRVVSIVEE